MTFLQIYLRDHEAAALGGLELFRRSCKANRNTAYGSELERLTNEVRSDLEELRSLCRKFEVKFSNVERALSLTGVTVGRLKPNGRVFTYSPLSRVLELEGLSGGVIAKLRMWESLRVLAPVEPRLNGADLTRLAAGAQAQLDALRRLHDMAAQEAFIDASHDAGAEQRARTTNVSQTSSES